MVDAPELIFDPSLSGSGSHDNSLGLSALASSAVTKCEVDVRRDLLGNVLLAGGSTMFSGISERVEHDLLAAQRTSRSVRVIAPPERKYSTW